MAKLKTGSPTTTAQPMTPAPSTTPASISPPTGATPSAETMPSAGTMRCPQCQSTDLGQDAHVEKSGPLARQTRTLVFFFCRRCHAPLPTPIVTVSKRMPLIGRKVHNDDRE
jgi:hypothetical protein